VQAALDISNIGPLKVKEAKSICCYKKKFKSSNKCKTAWDIIKVLPSKQHSKADIQELMINS